VAAGRCGDVLEVARHCRVPHRDQDVIVVERRDKEMRKADVRTVVPGIGPG
jgi:hypothetical protein